MLSSVANSDAAKVLVIVNKIIFLFIDSGGYDDKKRRELSGMEEDRVENLWAKTSSQATYFLSMFYIVISFCFFPFPFPFPFLGILGNDSL